MKRAIAYTSDIILGRTGDVISRTQQKKEIEAYAAANDIEIVAWYEDSIYHEDVMTRPGVQKLLAHEHNYDLVLVERVWSFSRHWPVLEQFYAELQQRGLKLEAATTMWDCISQMSRRLFYNDLASYKTPRALVTREEAGAVELRRPARLHFAKLKGRV